MSATVEGDAVDAAIQRWRGEPGALLPLLQDVQGVLGFIPSSAVASIANALNLSRAEVHGVISFYHDLRSSPGGRHRVQICRAEACQALGARALEQRAEELAGTVIGKTTDDGAISLEAVYCLGNCACGPSVRIDDQVHGRVDGDRLEALLADCRQPDAP